MIPRGKDKGLDLWEVGGGRGHCFLIYQRCFFSPISRLVFGASSFSLLIIGYVGFLLPGVKLLEPEADMSHRSSAEMELYLLLGMSHN